MLWYYYLCCCWYICKFATHIYGQAWTEKNNIREIDGKRWAHTKPIHTLYAVYKTARIDGAGCERDANKHTPQYRVVHEQYEQQQPHRHHSKEYMTRARKRNKTHWKWTQNIIAHKQKQQSRCVSLLFFFHRFGRSSLLLLPLSYSSLSSSYL